MAKILVVDDEKNVVELVAYLLETEGHHVVTAMDGQTCLTLAAMEQPHLIVLDVMLPVMDGFTVCTKLAEEDETRRIPVLILTAKGRMRDVFSQYANVAAYLEKPFDPNDLRSQVAKILAARAA